MAQPVFDTAFSDLLVAISRESGELDHAAVATALARCSAALPSFSPDRLTDLHAKAEALVRLAHHVVESRGSAYDSELREYASMNSNWDLVIAAKNELDGAAKSAGAASAALVRAYRAQSRRIYASHASDFSAAIEADSEAECAEEEAASAVHDACFQGLTAAIALTRATAREHDSALRAASVSRAATNLESRPDSDSHAADDFATLFGLATHLPRRPTKVSDTEDDDFDDDDGFDFDDDDDEV